MFKLYRFNRSLLNTGGTHKDKENHVPPVVHLCVNALVIFLSTDEIS